jgi:hypothetical protein
MNWETALLHGLLWSLLWSVTIFITVSKWPQLVAHDYPPEIRQVITLPETSQKRNAHAFTIGMTLIIIAFVFWSAISTALSAPFSFWTILSHLFVILMFWNVFDLLIWDWLIFCTLQPKFMVLPGSEGHPAYKDYKFHFIGFLKGCGFSAIGSLFFAAISFAVLKFLIP